MDGVALQRADGGTVEAVCCMRDVCLERLFHTGYMALLLANGGGKGGGTAEVSHKSLQKEDSPGASLRAILYHWRRS